MLAHRRAAPRATGPGVERVENPEAIEPGASQEPAGGAEVADLVVRSIDELALRIPADTPRRARVLVVDDRRENLVAIQRVLAHLPVELSCHTSGEEALRATLRGRFALALLDVRMPEIDGYELAGLLRSATHTRHLPVVFLTASDQTRLDEQRGYDAGAIDFVRKPVEPSVLIGKVQGFLRLHEAQLAVERLNEDLRAEVGRRREAEAELRRHQQTLEAEVAERTRDLRQFLYAAAHYLKSPLRTAGSFARLLLEDLEAGDLREVREDAERIESAALRMTTLLDAMAEYGGAAAWSLDLHPLGPAVYFAEAARALNMVGAVTIGELPAVRGAGFAMRRVAEELLRNARDHGAGGDLRVEVEGDVRQGRVRLRIRDNGPGISAHDLSRVFEPFYRARPGEGDSVGIGLPLCRSLVSRQGGEIRVRSTEGEGTEVELELFEPDPTVP